MSKKTITLATTAAPIIAEATGKAPKATTAIVAAPKAEVTTEAPKASGKVKIALPKEARDCAETFIIPSGVWGAPKDGFWFAKKHLIASGKDANGPYIVVNSSALKRKGWNAPMGAVTEIE